MGTLRGFPNPPAMSSGRQSPPTLHARLKPRRHPLAIVVAALAVGGQAHADKVPGIVLSPKAAESAPLVETHIAEVTVFSDRARIRRRGRAPGKAGVELVRFPSLPGAVQLDTIRVSANGGRVLRVEATPVQRERLSIEQAGKLLDALDAVGDRLADIDDRRASDDWEVSFLRALSPAPPVSEEKREGRKNLVPDVASWWKALDFVGERGRAANGRLLKLEGDRRELVEERERLLADVQALNRGGFSDRVVDVVAIVDLARAGAELELEYFVPGARWKPAYDLHFASARGQIRVETAAVVEQATGEDWTDATLLLSTAMPGRGIDLPELLTWTLGERSEFVPQLRARRPPVVEPPPPFPATRVIADDKRAIDAEIVRIRLAQASATPAQHKDEKPGVPMEAEVRRKRRSQPYQRDEGYEQPLSAPSGPAGMAAAAPAMAPPPPPPAPSDQEEVLEAEEAPVAIHMSGRRYPLAGAPAIRRSKQDKEAGSMTSVPLALYDVSAPARGPVLTDPYLPAVSAGGLDYVYQAPTKATIASSGKQVRIPLASQTFKATAFHEATPALATTAFLRARVRNDGKRPLLRGPATIFGDGELVGVGEIQTTGPGGDIEFPLGADQDVRLVRQVVPNTKTTGVIMKSEETTYDVQLQVANYKKQKVTVEIVDQIPRSRRDKVEIKLLGVQPAATGAPDADGVIRWRLDLAPGATQTLKLSYRITRPKDWQLYQN
jgi:hypothetical protein